MVWQTLNEVRGKLQQYPTRHQQYGPLPPIRKTIQVRRTRHAGHCWRSRDELISDVLLWTPTYGRAKAGRPARRYIQQREDTGCSPENLPEAMNDWEKRREREGQGYPCWRHDMMMRGKLSTLWVKLKTARRNTSEADKHFKDLLRNSPEITYKTILIVVD